MHRPLSFLYLFLLFQSNLCAFCFELCLQLFCFCLGSCFLYNLRSAVYNFFCFLQTKTCCFTNNLDNLNLVRANLCQLYVEFCLFFLSFCRACCCYNNACCCRYAKLFLTSFYQFVQL